MWVAVDRGDVGARAVASASIWDMYVKTYQSIGLVIESPTEMEKYEAWDVYVTPGGDLVAFALFRVTGYGRKRCLIGTDLRPESRKLLKQFIAQHYDTPGVYSEVSHRMEELARAAGAPVVCASAVPSVIGKSITPMPDGVHYLRVLAQVGGVVKSLVGRPYNVPTTTFDHPACDGEVAGHYDTRRPRTDMSREAMIEHLSSLIEI